MGQKTLTIKLDPEEHKKVKVLAAEMGITVKALLLRCVDRLKQEQDKAKED